MNSATTHASRMDVMYRRQRHIYDLSRKYFLFGRDTMLSAMTPAPGERVLEVGCGTARNLIALAGKHPEVSFFGVDISNEMLNTARAGARRAKVSKRLTLAQCAAEHLRHRDTFGLDAPFDLVFFSYSLSMIPTWRRALDVAFDNLRPGGSLWIVDFWDQKDLPDWFERMLNAWIRRFDVTPRPEVIELLEERSNAGEGRLTVESVGGRYAFIAQFVKANQAATPIG